jgi:hypothetical protein
MIKRLWFFALTLALMVSLAGAAFTPAAAAGGGKSITLVGAQYVPGKGVVFSFDVKGDFKQGFGGIAKIGGVTFHLTDCKLKDNGMLACVGEQGLSQYVGKIANVTVNGFSGSGMIRHSTQYFCYSVYDWGGNNSTPGEWYDIGPYCQPSGANVGDWINYYNPHYHTDFHYYFHDDGIPCFHAGKAYYFPGCPSNPN